MDIKEITKQIRHLDIVTNRKVTEVFSGNYRSTFKGQGMEFEDVREYVYGDDVKNIDWNITAREGRPFIKKYREERELTTMFLVDASGSMNFGTTGMMKKEIALRLAAILAFSCAKNNDKVGSLIYSDEINFYMPPKKGKSYVLQFLRDLIISFDKNKNNNTDLKQALRFFNNIQKKRTVCFLITDDIDLSLEKEIAILNKRHDLVILRVQDIFEKDIDRFSGVITIQDAEGDEIEDIELTEELKEMYKRDQDEKEGKIKKFCNKYSIDLIDLNSEKNLISELSMFFKKRQNRN